jgi:hypothetical protein
MNKEKGTYGFSYGNRSRCWCCYHLLDDWLT